LYNIESELQFDSPHRPNFGRSPLSSRRGAGGELSEVQSEQLGIEMDIHILLSMRCLRHHTSLWLLIILFITFRLHLSIYQL